MIRNTIIVLFVLTLAAAAEPARFYVAPSGSDSSSGTKPPQPEGYGGMGNDGPFASLEAARDAIRKLKNQGALPEDGAEAVVCGGTYRLYRPIELTGADSGTPEAPITFRAAPGEVVRILGGPFVNGFEPVTDEAVLAQLPEAAREHVVCANVKTEGSARYPAMPGVADFGKVTGGGLELFFDGRPMTLSRWPNEGFVHIADIVVDDGHQIHGHKGSKTGQFVYEGDRPARWESEKDPWLHGYWFWDWSEQRQRIESIDLNNRVITLEKPYHNYGYRKGQWYYAFNLLSEIDMPGEWYLDRDTGMLYFWPPASLDGNEALVSETSSAFVMNGASHVILRGFTFEAFRGTVVRVKGGSRNRVAACTFRNCGANAVSVSGGEEHGVIGCDISLMAAGGVSLSGGDRKTLTPAAHFAENNHIHHYARWYRVYRPGLSLQGVGNRASHNLIHDAPHMGIGFGGNDHLIELNEVHDVCLESNDAGAMYTGRDWTMRGHVIRHNFLHHITGFRGRGCVGVYLDDMFSSADITGNVFYKVTRAAFIGGGRDCSIVNNLFVDCEPALHIDARAMNWAHGHADGWIAEAKEKGTIKGIEYDEPPYSERYPELVNIIEDEPKAPKGNLIARNVCWGGKWDEVYDPAGKYLNFEDNLVGTDPKIADREAMDFRLEEDSPAFEMGFEPIPFEEIGLYQDADRASWPPRK